MRGCPIDHGLLHAVGEAVGESEKAEEVAHTAAEELGIVGEAGTADIVEEADTAAAGTEEAQAATRNEAVGIVVSRQISVDANMKNCPYCSEGY